jgi:hypothetical protein
LALLERGDLKTAWRKTMAQDRDYRHWDEDWRGRRAQGEGENQRGRDGGYSSGHMESGFGDRGPNRYGGREEWRASSFGPRNYGSQEDASWRGRDEDRWSRGRGGGEREHSGWGERTGRGEHGGSGHEHAARQRVGFLPRNRAAAFDCQHSPQCSDASTVTCEGLTRYHRHQCPKYDCQ